MDDKNQKERLEQELRFLKESFEAEVISKEEFEKGKERIERKLREAKEAEKAAERGAIKAQEPEEAREQEEVEKEVQIEAEEVEAGKEISAQKEAEAIEPEQEYVEAVTPEQKAEVKKPEVKEEIKEGKKSEEEREESKVLKEEGVKSRFFKYAAVLAIVLLIAVFSYSLFKDSTKQVEKPEQIIRLKQAEFAAPKTNVMVLNDRKNCFNCETQRVLDILESWFGEINAKEIDYNTPEGKSLAEKFNATVLPMYILDGNITEKQNFGQFKHAFAKKDSSYALSDDAAGSTFYFRRESIPNKLELFAVAGDSTSIKAENNLKEFLEAFKDAKFEKHLSTDNLAKELGIKAFPAFLVNNRVKFSGVHTAEAVKENFCRLNKLAACKKSLSKGMV